MYAHREIVEIGDKILKGAKPSKTAKALGLTIPQSVLVRADEVIPVIAIVAAILLFESVFD